MDNLRKQKPRLSSGTDGFVSGSTSSANQPRTSSNFTAKTQSASRSLGGFGRAPGFSPSSNLVAQGAAKAGPRAPKRTAVGTIDMTLPDGKPKGRRDWRKTRKRIFKGAAVFAALFAVTVGFLIFKGIININGVLQGGGNAAALNENVDPSQLNGEGDGRVNILLLGRGGEGNEGPNLTDTILVASVDPVQKQASLLSVPRDLWVKNGSGSSKINAIYANAKSRSLRNNSGADAEKKSHIDGTNAIKDKVEETMGIPVHYYVMVDFKAFEDAVNIVGGVSIDVDENGTVFERLYDPSTRKQYVLNVKEGPNDFDGKRALFYARSRLTSGGGDFDRAERQRALIIALKDKVLSAGTYSNPVKISQLISNFGNRVSSDLSTNDIARLYEIAGSIDSSKITSLGLTGGATDYVTTANLDGQSIVRPIPGLYDYSEIQSFVRNTLKDSFLLSENATVAVYNGTSIAGLASDKAKELKSFGYNVITIDSAPTANYTQTTLVDRTRGTKRFTKNYLEQRLNVKAINNLPDATITTTADFVIILGSNEKTEQ